MDAVSLRAGVDDLCSQYMDGYASFGWRQDGNLPNEKSGSRVTLHFKRRRAEKVAPLIDAKYDGACAVCEKAQQLL